MNQYLALLKRELRSILKEKTIVFAIMVQFFVASFSSIILVGIMAFYDPSSISENSQVNVRVGVVSETGNPLPDYLRDGNLRVSSFSDASRAEAAFLLGQVDAVMIVPENRSDVVDMKLILPELDARKTVIFMMLDEPLKRYENHLRQVNGVQLNYADSGGKPHTTYEFLYSVIVPILMLFPALIAGSIVIDTVSEEMENKTFDTLMSAPVSLGQVFMSKISAAVLTVVIQVIMWVGLLRLNSITVLNPALVILLAVIIATTISFVTGIIALYFKDRERAQFVYSIVLVTAVGGSYFLDPSPFGLISRLAAGDPGINMLYVVPYLVPLVTMGVLFLRFSRRLVFARN